MLETLKLFWTFFKVGSVTFGSGYVMVTVVEGVFVDKKKWFTREQFMNYITLATSFPGPIVINLASLIGHQKFGTKGLIAGFLGAALPSFLVLLAVAMSFNQIADEPVVVAIFKGLRPAVVGLILYPVIKFAKNINKWEYPLFVGIAALLYFNIISAIMAITIGIVAGFAIAFYKTKNVSQK